jgi:membrane associated rhomboid family serine protease
MLIPYTTDAPVYYWPFATVGLIVANVVIFFGVAFGNLGDFDGWMLEYGNGLHPDQWFRSMFMHGSLEHLVSNMLFLWVFGLVVEGKLGWWKFLCCYMAIGVSEAAIEQAVMLGYSGETYGSLGASAAIFGLMAMAAIWAPMNEITFMWLIWYFWSHTVDVGIAVLAVVYTGLEILMLLITAGGAGGSWLHLGGFLLGIPLGVVLLKRGIVDCEGWDIFHVWSGDYGSFKKEPEPQEVFAKVDAVRQSRDAQMLVEAKKQLRLFLQNGNAAAALKLYEKMKEVGGGLTLDRDELLAIVQSLHKEKRWTESAPYMGQFIQRFPAQADAMRIKLAQICVLELERPGKALELLHDVDKSKLTEQQATLIKRIAAKAQQMQMEGTVEFDVDTW